MTMTIFLENIIALEASWETFDQELHQFISISSLISSLMNAFCAIYVHIKKLTTRENVPNFKAQPQLSKA